MITTKWKNSKIYKIFPFFKSLVDGFEQLKTQQESQFRKIAALNGCKPLLINFKENSEYIPYKSCPNDPMLSYMQDHPKRKGFVRVNWINGMSAVCPKSELNITINK